MRQAIATLVSRIKAIDHIWTVLYGNLLILLFVYSFLFLVLISIGQPGYLNQTAVLRFVRGAVFLFLTTLLLQLVFDCRKLRLHLIFSASPAILTIVLYSIPLAKGGQLAYLGQYYTWAPLLFSVTFLLLFTLENLGRFRLPLIPIYTAFYILFLMLPLSYFAYFSIYQSAFDTAAFISVLNTSPGEAKAWLLQFFPPGFLTVLPIFSALLFLLIGISVRKLTAPENNDLSFRPRYPKLLCLFCLILLYLFPHHLLKTFPLDMYTTLTQNKGLLHAFTQLKQNAGNNAMKIVLPQEASSELSTKKTPGSILLVIGESANRDHMSAFADPSQKKTSAPSLATSAAEDSDILSPDISTTPWESACVNLPDFVFFTESYANFPNTVMAVTQALTSVNQYNAQELKDAVTLIDVAKKAGYKTYWLSMQEKGGVHDAGVTVIAERADKQVWSRGYDEAILTDLKRLPPDQNNFVVLHLMGSHNRYPERVPDVFLQSRSLPEEEPFRKYRHTLLYTDFVLQQIFEFSRKYMNLQAMIYFSDHGEDMKYMHTASPFYFSMVRIPFWIYLSPAYQKAYPDKLPVLKKHSRTVFTNDLIFDTVSGLLQTHSNFYRPEYDISSKKYSLTRKTARTMHGEVKITQEDGNKEKSRN